MTYLFITLAAIAGWTARGFLAREEVQLERDKGRRVALRLLGRNR